VAADNCVDAFVAGEICRVGGLALTKRALDLCGFQPEARLADIGCGKGATVNYLRAVGFDAFGIDCDAEVIKYAGQYCQVGDARFLPYANDSMAGLFFECSLSQMTAPYQVLCEALRVLRPNGLLVISDIYARNEELQTGNPLLNRSQWLELCDKANFACQLFEDRSEDLKSLSAQLLWRHDREIPEELYCSHDAETLKSARCGYFLMIAGSSLSITNRTTRRAARFSFHPQNRNFWQTV
jgi:SAM-dependent methyltransferase